MIAPEIAKPTHSLKGSGSVLNTCSLETGLPIEPEGLDNLLHPNDQPPKEIALESTIEEDLFYDFDLPTTNIRPISPATVDNLLALLRRAETTDRLDGATSESPEIGRLAFRLTDQLIAFTGCYNDCHREAKRRRTMAGR